MGYLSCKAESSVATAETTHKQQKIQEFNYKDLELATSNFSDTKLLGRGSHGLVYKGVLRGGKLVAIKKSSRTSSQRFNVSENPNEVDNEIDILSKLQSPRLVNLVGFSHDESRERLLVVEFMSNGTLYDILHVNHRPLHWGRRIKLALQTAKAIDTLHSLSPPLIHRDIKSANVLIDRNFNARLGDFGLALRCVDGHRLKSTPPAGTMGYLDPCYVTPDNLSTKTDVFSFGILLLEIISGRKALDMGNSPPSIVDWAIPLIRRGKSMAVYDPRLSPPNDPMVRKMLPVVAAKCVRSCRERRPSMKEVVGCLSELSKLVSTHSWNGLANNPCMMVENVGRPVQVRSRNVSMNVNDPGGNENVRRESKTSVTRRRVYSDLGFRSNLMELMAGPSGESRFHGEDDDLEHKLESVLGLESGGFNGENNISSVDHCNGKEETVSRLRQNEL